jgi:hypothetical protein
MTTDWVAYRNAEDALVRLSAPAEKTEWEQKLRALLEGAEYNDIDKLIALGQVGDYRALGELTAQRTKEAIAEKTVPMAMPREDDEKKITPA